MMRTIFLTQWFDPEPGAIRGLPLARWLTARGHDVRVLTSVPNYPGGRVYPGYRMRLWQREVIDGVPVLRVPLYPSHDTSPLGRVANYTSFALSAATLGAALIGRGDVAYVYRPPATLGLPAVASPATRSTSSTTGRTRRCSIPFRAMRSSRASSVLPGASIFSTPATSDRCKGWTRSSGRRPVYARCARFRSSSSAPDSRRPSC